MKEPARQGGGGAWPGGTGPHHGLELVVQPPRAQGGVDLILQSAGTPEMGKVAEGGGRGA